MILKTVTVNFDGYLDVESHNEAYTNERRDGALVGDA